MVAAKIKVMLLAMTMALSPASTRSLAPTPAGSREELSLELAGWTPVRRPATEALREWLARSWA